MNKLNSYLACAIDGCVLKWINLVSININVFAVFHDNWNVYVSETEIILSVILFFNIIYEHMEPYCKNVRRDWNGHEEITVVNSVKETFDARKSMLFKC